MIAQHQLAARKGAEVHQTQLCKAIGFYGVVLGEFQRLFHERLRNLNDFPHNEDRATTFSQHKKIRFGATDTEIFAYIKELDAVYAQTDKTLQAWRLESTDANWDAPSETWDEDPDTGYFQFRVDSPENTVALKVRRTTCLTSGGIASVLRCLVIRRYEADGRMVLVWRVFTEGEGFFTGMHADETGWGVATAVEGSSKTGTVLRTCVHNAPMNFSNVTARNHVVKQFGGQLLEWGRKNNEEATLGLERLLLRNE
ncbi:hypothetical protein PI125_g12696 [Phytophthora idaei]|nr:hypothetical protein PI125_g12696 [Phytophthora idaei]